MGDHDALGLACRPRGVDDVGEAPRRGVVRQVEIALAGDRRLLGVEQDEARELPQIAFGSGGVELEEARETPFGHQHRASGPRQRIAGDEAQPVARIAGIERHVRSSGLQDPQYPDHQVERALQAQRHPVFRHHTQPPQAPGQAVRPPVELAVGQARSRADHRHRLRRALDRGLEPPVQTAEHGRRRRGAAPFDDQLMTLAGGEQRQRADAQGRAAAGSAAGLRRQRAGQGLELCDHALGGGGVEQVAVELQRAGQRVAGLRHQQGQLELRAAPPQGDRVEPETAEVERRAAAAEGEAAEAALAPPALPVEREHHLEDRRAARVARGAQPLGQQRERVVLVCERRERRLPDAAEQLVERRISRQVAADHHRVDEVTHQAGQLGRAPRGRGAHQQLVLAHVAMEQHQEDREEGHERCRPGAVAASL